MPNGGADNCMTCSFARRIVNGSSGADGRRTGGKGRAAASEPVACTIRDVEIARPASTYCANHPKHNHDLVGVPVGGVYVPAEEGSAQARQVLLPSPDTELVRRGLIDALEAIPELPRREYPTPTAFEPILVMQLGAFGERRAVLGLRRLLTLDPQALPGDGSRTYCRRTTLIGFALAALAQIAGEEAPDDIEPWLAYGLDGPAFAPHDEGRAREAASLRLAAVEALGRCGGDRAGGMLRRALDDPDAGVARRASALLGGWERR